MKSNLSKAATKKPKFRLPKPDQLSRIDRAWLEFFKAVSREAGDGKVEDLKDDPSRRF